jgi:cytochrome c
MGSSTFQSISGKHALTKDTDEDSGANMDRAYCAVCHGLDGKGAGAAATAMRQPPWDLTRLSRRAGGEFARFRYLPLCGLMLLRETWPLTYAGGKWGA